MSEPVCKIAIVSDKIALQKVQNINNCAYAFKILWFTMDINQNLLRIILEIELDLFVRPVLYAND